MPAKKLLVRRIRELIESAALLRGALQRYEKTMAGIADRLEGGEAAVTAAKGTQIPSERRRVTEAIEEFEAARHELRLALIGAGTAEGASLSEIGQVLGISRQLASRLAGEVRRKT